VDGGVPEVVLGAVVDGIGVDGVPVVVENDVGVVKAKTHKEEHLYSALHGIQTTLTR